MNMLLVLRFLKQQVREITIYNIDETLVGFY